MQQRLLNNLNGVIGISQTCREVGISIPFPYMIKLRHDHVWSYSWETQSSGLISNLLTSPFRPFLPWLSRDQAELIPKEWSIAS